MSKKKWEVSVPFAGVFYVEGVEADSADEAVQAAIDLCHEHADVVTTGPVDLGEWSAHGRLAEGNCLNAPQNSAEAEEMQ